MALVFHEVTREAVLIRVLASILIGGLIGLDRTMKNRPAGLRTYMMVCAGSCLIMMTNQYIYQYTGAGDPMRLGAQVVSGIGFLGAGVIIKDNKNSKVRGLTTAATLWCDASIGVLCAGGFLKEAGIEIKEMNSGCICCSLVGDFATNLKEVIEKLIENKYERYLVNEKGFNKVYKALIRKGFSYGDVRRVLEKYKQTDY